MIMLISASSYHWSQTGIGQLRSNWEQGTSTGSSASSVVKQIYYGTCLGMLGLTGFECMYRFSSFIELNSIRLATGTPSYISRIKPGKYPLVLRNLHIPSIILNSVIMLLVLAIIPLDVVQGGANVLSVLAQQVSIKIGIPFWLKVRVIANLNL